MSAVAMAPAAPVALFVDLDGTLIKSDLLIEGMLMLLNRSIRSTIGMLDNLHR